MAANLSEAARVVSQGGIIAYPTEGVFGIGCDPMNVSSLRRIIAIKGRAAEKGMIVVAGSLGLLTPMIEPLDEAQELRILPTWPGPVTWVVRAGKHLPDLLTGSRPTLAIRVSEHPVVIALSALCGHPLVSTSANFSGQPPCLNAAATRSMFGDLVDYTIDAEIGCAAGSSKIFDAQTGKQIR